MMVEFAEVKLGINRFQPLNRGGRGTGQAMCKTENAAIV